MKIFNINYNMTSRVGNVQSNGNILSKGDSGVNKIVVSFDEPQTDACYMVVKRYDGATTNNLYMTPDFANQNYYIVFQEWMTGVAGDLEITVKLVGDTEQTFGKVYLEVYDSLTESDETITDAQYQELLQSLNDHIGNTNNPHVTNADNAEYESGVSIKEKIDSDKQELDDHVSDKENPHDVTAEQVDTYNKSTIDQKDADTLQQAKDYTYSKVEIDNKDADKLDKIWTDLTNQTTSFLTDEFVLNRGNNAYKTTLATMLSNVVPIEIFVVVQELPEIGQINKIYLVISQDSEVRNIYEEFIWVFNEDTEEYEWERIGSASVDLSNYFNKTEINALLGGKVDKVAGKGLSSNDYTNGDKQNVEKIPTIEQDIVDLENDKVDKNNAITAGTKTKITYDEKGLVTGGSDLVETDIPTLPQSKITDLVTDLGNKVNKNANITGATKTKITYDSKGLVTAGEDLAPSDIPQLSPSKITQDANNRFVTDAEKSTWNGKQDALTAGDGISISGNVISADSGLAVEEWNTDSKILTLSDSNKLFKCSFTGNKIVTIPTNASVPFPIGTMISFLLTNTYKVSFFYENGVTLTSMDSLVELATEYGMASLIKTDTDTWQLVGALE